MRSFEQKILEKFSGTAKVIGVGTRVSWKGVWIRDHLFQMKEDYPYGMFLNWLEFAPELRVRPGDYQAFYKMVYIAKRLELVRAVREEPGEKGTTRVYYSLTPGSIRRREWLRLYQSMYPTSDWVLNLEEYKARGYKRKSKHR